MRFADAGLDAPVGQTTDQSVSEGFNAECACAGSSDLPVLGLDGEAGRVEVAVEGFESFGSCVFCAAACSSFSARMVSSLASTPATAWESREPHLDFPVLAMLGVSLL